MEPNTESKEPSEQQASFGTRVLNEVPLVSSAAGMAAYYYQSAKSYEYVKYGLEQVEAGASAFVQAARPYVEPTLDKYDVGAKAHSTLDSLQASYPILKEQPDVVMARSKEYAGQTYTTVAEAVTAWAPKGHESLEGVRQAMSEGVLGNLYSTSAALQQRLHTAAAATLDYLRHQRDNVKELGVREFLDQELANIRAAVASTQAYVLSSTSSAAANATVQVEAKLDAVKQSSLANTACEIGASVTAALGSVGTKGAQSLPDGVRSQAARVAEQLKQYAEALKAGDDAKLATATLNVLATEAAKVLCTVRDTLEPAPAAA